SRDNSVLHNLEYLADFGAIDLMIWYVNKRSKLNFKWFSRMSFAELHRLAIVACGVMCALWDACDRLEDSDGSHPEASARFGNLLAYYATQLSKSTNEEFFVHKIGKLAVMDLTLLGEACPEIALLTADMQGKIANDAHVAAMGDIFKKYRAETL